jgi:hypothetical protein
MKVAIPLVGLNETYVNVTFWGHNCRNAFMYAYWWFMQRNIFLQERHILQIYKVVQI